jgi:hypothetical protein
MPLKFWMQFFSRKVIYLKYVHSFHFSIFCYFNCYYSFFSWYDSSANLTIFFLYHKCVSFITIHHWKVITRIYSITYLLDEHSEIINYNTYSFYQAVFGSTSGSGCHFNIDDKVFFILNFTLWKRVYAGVHPAWLHLLQVGL